MATPPREFLRNYPSHDQAAVTAWWRSLDVAKQQALAALYDSREDTCEVILPGRKTAAKRPRHVIVDSRLLEHLSRVTPGQELSRLENEVRMAVAIEDLPPDYREVVILRSVQRLSFNEVAKQMGRSRPAVQMLWMRAIRKLEDALGAERPAGG